MGNLWVSKFKVSLFRWEKQSYEFMTKEWLWEFMIPIPIQILLCP